MNAILDPAVLAAIEAAEAEFIAIRRDIHQHPEIGFKEHRTAALVAARLRAWGYEVDEGLGGTGVWATVLEPALEAVTGATAKKNFAGLVAT